MSRIQEKGMAAIQIIRIEGYTQPPILSDLHKSHLAVGSAYILRTNFTVRVILTFMSLKLICSSSSTAIVSFSAEL